MKKFRIPLEIAGFSVITGQVGEAIGSQGLKDAGTTAANYVKPATNIAGASTLVDMLKKLRRKK